MGKKKFIEKGEGVKFYLVHRSQRDPLYLDETLGEHVLVPADPEDEQSTKLIESLQGLKLGPKSKKDREEARMKRIEEQHKYGIYYDDDYNYLQHLRETNHDEDGDDSKLEKSELIKVGSVLIKDEEDNYDLTSEPDKSKLVLPSSVFASKFEEDVGYFNQAAPDSDPKIGWDPDIVKYLDDDDDEHNLEFTNEEFEDDFFVRADADNDDDNDKDDEGTLDGEDDDEEEEEDDVNSDFGGNGYEKDNDFEESESVRDFEKQSRFSNYSMSSSVIRRNEALKYIDEHFEKFFEQYDQDQIGALETEDIEGFRRSNDLVLENAIKEFNKYMEKKYYKQESGAAKMSALAEEEYDEEDGEEDGEEEGEERDELADDLDQNNNTYETVKYTRRKDKEDRLDCESVISTYSNLYNRPAMISEKRNPRTKKAVEKDGLEPNVKLSVKTGLPLGVLPEKLMSKNQMDKLDHRITRVLPEIPQRKEEETKEEKKARKQAIKEHRRERRMEKKTNKTMFKEENKLQISQMIQGRQTARGVKLPL